MFVETKPQTMEKQKTPLVKGIAINGKNLKNLFNHLYNLEERADKEIKEKREGYALKEIIIIETALLNVPELRNAFREYKSKRKEIEKASLTFSPNK